MKRVFNVLDLYLRGPIALGVAVLGTVFLLLIIFRPLPWQHFPNVLRIFSASWLHLVICGGIVASALGTVGSIRGFPHSMLTCVIIGLLWPYIPFLNFLPHFLGRWMLIYGLTGLVGHAIRRIRSQPLIRTSEQPMVARVAKDQPASYSESQSPR